MARFFRVTMDLTKGLFFLTITKCYDHSDDDRQPGGLPACQAFHMMESPPATCMGRQARGAIEARGPSMSKDTFIEITLAAGVPSNEWQRVATRHARLVCESRGLDWLEAEVLVKLPFNRALYKSPGFATLASYN